MFLGKYTKFYFVGGEVEKFGALAEELLQDRPRELGEARTGYMHERK